VIEFAERRAGVQETMPGLGMKAASTQWVRASNQNVFRFPPSELVTLAARTTYQQSHYAGDKRRGERSSRIPLVATQIGANDAFAGGAQG
jgi:hypothetical protein